MMPEEYVGSGSFSISHSGKNVLVTILGSCVGLALYDKKAGVGGVAHFLLPDPTSTTTSWNPENYASTGLPVFIKELLDGGAIKERLEATVAGGSLPCPLTEADLNLDLGGRTTEIVLEILSRENIPIIKSETGGFTPSVLRLDTKTWETTILPIKQINEKSKNSNYTKPTPDQINTTIEQTKPIPQIALKVIRLLRDERYNMSDLAEEIRHDQVLGAKILRYCNSVMVGARKRIGSIDHALLFLGSSHLLEIVVSTSIYSFFSAQTGGYSLMRGGLYKHALGVAMVAKETARFTGRVEPGTAYTAGLLHDIGKVVLDQLVAGSCSLFNQSSPSEHSDFIELEANLFGVDHQETGKRLAINWRFPGTLVEAIELHHSPEKAKKNKELVHVVYLADLLASWFMAGAALERVNTDSIGSRLEQIGLQPAQLNVIVDRVPWNKLMYM